MRKEKKFYILTINPGSTSTKIGLYENEKELFVEVIRHQIDEITQFAKISDQYEFRKKIILDVIAGHKFDIASLSAVVGRGGLLKPLLSGTYEINNQMLSDLKEAFRGEHASNLGAIIADSIAKEVNCPAFIVDPVVVDEMTDIARISGHPKLPRKSIFHALNQKSTARLTARLLKKKYEKVTLIVAHMGGGISIGLHKKGQVVDVNNALDGEGPFSPERSGSLPAAQLVKICFMGNLKEYDVKKMITGNGGVVAYLGTNDLREVNARIKKGEKDAKLIYDALIYQISKEIGALAAAAGGDIDGIVLTGGLAYDKKLVSEIKKHVEFISRVFIFPGEEELPPLRDGALRVLRKEEKPKTY